MQRTPIPITHRNAALLSQLRTLAASLKRHNRIDTCGARLEQGDRIEGGLIWVDQFAVVGQLLQ